MKELDLLKKELAKLNIIYVSIEDEHSIIKIYDLYANKKKFKPIDDVECYYVGMYHYIHTSDNCLVKKYFLIAIDQGHVLAMYNLAMFYVKNKEYANAEKYFLMAIDHGDVASMIQLADMYLYKYDYVDAEKYYLMAIAHDSVEAMNKLGKLYMNDIVNTSLGIKYHTMAAEKGMIESTSILAKYYEYKHDYVNAEKYYLLLIKENCIIFRVKAYFLNTKKDPIGLLNFCIENREFIDRLSIIRIVVEISTRTLDDKQHESFIKFLSSFSFLPQDNLPKLLRSLTNSLQYNIDMMKLHFEYTVNGKGFNEARDDFIKSIK